MQRSGPNIWIVSRTIAAMCSAAKRYCGFHANASACATRACRDVSSAAQVVGGRRRRGNPRSRRCLGKAGLVGGVLYRRLKGVFCPIGLAHNQLYHGAAGAIALVTCSALAGCFEGPVAPRAEGRYGRSRSGRTGGSCRYYRTSKSFGTRSAEGPAGPPGRKGDPVAAADSK
jgi:hypothetical protein